MKALRVVLLVLAIAGLVVFFSPRWTRETEPGLDESRFEMGFSPDPWLVRWERKTEEKIDRGGQQGQKLDWSYGTTVHFVSWSWAFLAGAVALLAVARRCRP